MWKSISNIGNLPLKQIDKPFSTVSVWLDCHMFAVIIYGAIINLIPDKLSRIIEQTFLQFANRDDNKRQ